MSGRGKRHLYQQIKIKFPDECSRWICSHCGMIMSCGHWGKRGGFRYRYYHEARLVAVGSSGNPNVPTCVVMR